MPGLLNEKFSDYRCSVKNKREKEEMNNVVFRKKIVILGFGGIGQAILPLLFRHLHLTSEQVVLLTKNTNGQAEAEHYHVKLVEIEITPENYQAVLTSHLQSGDFLLNLSVDVSSVALIAFCQKMNVLYLDTCIEPWAGGYTNPSLSPSHRSNYALRETALALKKNQHTPTAILTHGANPGLVSYFVKQALMNIAKDNQLDIEVPRTQSEWALLSQRLNIKAIHIAERDTQIASLRKRQNEFVNTWSVKGFISEGSQPAELGWGTHEQCLPADGNHHDFGCQSAIYLNRPGAATRVRTWTPAANSFHGFLITHGESISIADYFTLKKDNAVLYRPTVHYAYHPCEDALLSLQELAEREWHHQSEQRQLGDDIVDGMDELGVLLMGNQKGAYWYGSHLTIQEARQLAPYNTAFKWLQVY